MPAYNFKPEFVTLVEDGTKRQTIRKRRRRATLPGDVLHLFTGLRTAAVRRLGSHWCWSVSPLAIRADGLHLDGMPVLPDLADQIAIADGFADLYAMTDFMTRLYGPLPIDDLRLIKWDHLVVADVALVAHNVKPYTSREHVADTIPAGTIGRIVGSSMSIPPWTDQFLTVDFAEFDPHRTVSAEYIRHVYAPDHVWPDRPFRPLKITVDRSSKA